MLLLICIIFIVSTEFVIIPRLVKENAYIKYRLKVAQRAASYARELKSERNYEKALSILDVYLDMDEGNQEMLVMYNEIMKIISEESFTTELPEEVFDKTQEEEPSSYYERGSAEYENGNYYSALYYLERALTLHKDNEEIKELYRRSKKQVENSLGKLTKQEKRKKWLIENKEKALEHMNNAEFYEAYAIFLILSNMYPEMKDLGLYLSEVTRELKKVDFLPEELKVIEWLPALNNIVFIDKQGYINTIERTIPYNNNFYFYNIKRHKSQKGKTIVTSWKYGKWIDDKIRVKNEEGFKKVSEKQAGIYYIVPYIDPGYLIYFSEGEELLNFLSIYERFSISENLFNSGFDIERMEVYFSKKIGIYFSIYVLTLFLSALAWAKRSIYEFPPVLKLFLFVLVVPFMAYFLYLLYIEMNNIIIFSHRYFTRLMFRNLNLNLFTVIINIVLSIIATLYYLSQSSKVE
jgi:tetratricopeptide (TPR) repeat protein